MKEKYSVDKAVKLNRVMVVLLIVVALVVALNSSDKTAVDVKMQGITLDLGQSADYETTDLEFKGTLEKKLFKPVYFKGDMVINGDVFTSKDLDKDAPSAMRIVKIDGGSVYDYGTLYIDEHLSEVMLIINGTDKDHKTVIVAPARDVIDATTLANKILSEHEKR